MNEDWWRRLDNEDEDDEDDNYDAADKEDDGGYDGDDEDQDEDDDNKLWQRKRGQIEENVEDADNVGNNDCDNDAN